MVDSPFIFSGLINFIVYDNIEKGVYPPFPRFEFNIDTNSKISDQRYEDFFDSKDDYFDDLDNHFEKN